MYLGGYINGGTSHYFQNQFVNAVGVSALLDERVFQPDQTAKQDAEFIIVEIQISFLAEHVSSLPCKNNIVQNQTMQASAF